VTALRLPHRGPEAVPIVTAGPVSAGSFAWQIRPPKDARVVVVKCTLALVPEGAAEPLVDQDPPNGDVLHDEDDAGGGQAPAPPSLRYPSDFAPFKPRADVLLVGHAYPPQRGAGIASVQLVFGQLHRALAAVGDRELRGGAPTAPAPFARMPLRYERAFGGPGHDANPVGAGLAGARLPNLEQPDRMIRGKGDRPAPACFAPVPAAFLARASKLGKYDGAWLRERWPYFPADFDWGYFNSAPAEQQIAYPRGDEPFSLSAVSPTVPVLRGRLPGLAPRAYTVATAGHALHEIPLRLDTVWFDADAARVVLVWRGLVEVSAEHAPELAALFVCDDRLGSTTDVAGAEQRLRAKLFELHGPAVTMGDPQRVPQTPPPPAPGSFAAGPVATGERPAPPTPPIVVPPAKTRDEVIALLASGASLEGVDLSRSDLSGLDLRGRKLAGALLVGARLDGACFDGADLAGAVLARARGERSSFQEASLHGANLAGATLVEANLAGAALDQATLADVDARGASFRGASLARVNFSDARLSSATFDGASAAAADFSGAALSGASFKGAVLDDAQLYGCAAEGCCFDEASLFKLRADDAKLSRSTFVRARGAESSFASADLTHAVLQGAELDGAVFAHADLSFAVLHRASAKGARFRHGRLVQASALKADFMEANFESADLTRADLRGANLYGVETLKATLSGAILSQALVAGSKLA
jgi:uncharacterized protein YjbI with pentapeptide repeats